MPSATVIIPAYIDNPDKIVWLGEALESVKRQTFTDWEAIIIDDSSPVNIGEIKVRFEADERFRWFKTSHNYGGPAMVRNTAVALAESEAILPLDADDQLGSNEALAEMYQAWQADKTRIVYGNLQRYPLEDNGVFVKKNVVELGDYTFERVKNPQGLFPVTAMHSIDCHTAAGGWKPELDAGFEDLEYWIAAGERGFCGHWLNHTTLIYRSYSDSRYHKMKISGRNQEMTAKIISMHKDIYDGRYPVGCCGGSKQTASPNGASASGAMAPKVTTLDEFRPDEKIWVEYQGLKTAAFRIISDVKSPVSEYRILGTGHTFQIHRNDINWFKRFAETINGQRQSAYKIGVPSPVEAVPEIEVVEATPPRQIQLAEIERLDNVAMTVRGIEQQPEAQPEPEPQAINGPIVVEQQQLLTQTYDLSELGLSPALQKILELENWTLEKLAGAEAIELTPYKTVGIKRAKAIIEAAQRAING